MNYIYKSYKIIDEIERKKSFSSILLNQALNLTAEEDKKYVTKIVYGVLDNSVKYDYYISMLCAKKPKASICTLLKIGMFLIYEMNSVKDYTAINETVKIAKKISKNTLGSFVNGVLRKAVDFDYPMPKEREKALSVSCSVPLVVAQKLVAEFGEEMATAILQSQSNNYECVRINLKKTTKQEFVSTLESLDVGYELLPVDNAVMADYKELWKKLPRSNLWTTQALASILCVDQMNCKADGEYIDICSAPGGKAIYMAEKASGGSVVACDIHEHRVDLIGKYAERMDVNNVQTKLCDGSQFIEEFQDEFDGVLCDVPCSGIGVMFNKRDILFGLTQEKIDSLVQIQKGILQNASRYVKAGGTLIYSTCTLLSQENENVALEFLKNNSNFIAVDIELCVPNEKREIGNLLLPNISGTVGFYMVKFKKC